MFAIFASHIVLTLKTAYKRGSRPRVAARLPCAPRRESLKDSYRLYRSLIHCAAEQRDHDRRWELITSERVPVVSTINLHRLIAGEVPDRHLDTLVSPPGSFGSLAYPSS